MVFKVGEQVKVKGNNRRMYVLHVKELKKGNQYFLYPDKPGGINPDPSDCYGPYFGEDLKSLT